jgi:hypothetical protein
MQHRCRSDSYAARGRFAETASWLIGAQHPGFAISVVAACGAPVQNRGVTRFVISAVLFTIVAPPLSYWPSYLPKTAFY